MSKDVLEVEIRAVLPTSGDAPFSWAMTRKVFVIYVDQTVGAAITMFMRSIPKERPQTHDLIASILVAVGAKVERAIIADVKGGVYFARLILTAENELSQKKIIEIDARPSDSIALCLQQDAPIYVSRSVWDEVEDMSEILEKVNQQGLGESAEDDESED
ncbi:MAG: bifunctional nuclease family protein [Verrucomicrobiales bacterium]